MEMGKVRRARRAAVAAATEKAEVAEWSSVFVVVVIVVAVVFVIAAAAAANLGLALPPSTISSSIFSCSRAAGVCVSASCVCTIDVHWVRAGRERKNGWSREEQSILRFERKQERVVKRTRLFSLFHLFFPLSVMKLYLRLLFFFSTDEISVSRVL